MTYFLTTLSWVLGSTYSAELLGYWLHRLLHSGAIAVLSRNHMKHHLVLYGRFRSSAQPLTTIRAEFWGNAYAGSVGELAHPFAAKISGRIKDAKLK